MHNCQDDLKGAKNIISENFNKCSSLFFFGIKNGNEVVGVTSGSDYEHARLLIKAAELDKSFASFLVQLGETVKELGIHQHCKN